MKKLNPNGIKWLKIIHLIFVVMWAGGAICMLSLALGINLVKFNEVNAAYLAMKILDDNVIRNGALGCLITGLFYSIGTNWGFIKHRWISLKWVILIFQFLFGIFCLNTWLTSNLAILKVNKDLAINSPIFIDNHSLTRLGILIQIVLFIFLIGISVLKPWKMKHKGPGEN